MVGEELGVLPGMDSIFSSLALERLVGFFGNIVQQNSKKEKFDIIIYDGMSTEETIRMIGATSKARLGHLKTCYMHICQNRCGISYLYFHAQIILKISPQRS